MSDNQQAHVQEKPKPREPMDGWDRSKVLLVLALAFWMLTWERHFDNEALPVREVIDDSLGAYWWIAGLFCLECLRQVHYLISEISGRYANFWLKTFAGAWESEMSTLDDWTRFRLTRFVRWAFGIAIFGVILGGITGKSPVRALVEFPSDLWSALPLLLQIAVYLFLGIAQFAGIFWFLSRGGVEVYNPGDIKTRFSDVWGQDHVVEKVRENIIFLQKPDEIERRGGHVPGGILLWGPPGTGKTLMAEAVAGETGKPYVFVDPGAFINMFLGVGILKVKGLFRRLRKLALRHGGVVVFFDEADSLGSRGGLGGGGFNQEATAAFGDCHGTAFLQPTTQAALLQSRSSSQSSSGGDGAPVRRLRDRMFMNFGGDSGTLQALLTEMSGLAKPRGFWNRTVRRALGMQPKAPPKYRILVMMATNMPNSLDEAMLRPGRIDRTYRVGYPSKEGRLRTYEGYFAKVANDLTAEQIDKLATITPYATGATIKDLVNESLINAIRNGREVVTWSDVTSARHLKQLGPSEGVEYVERERHATAIHEACHAVAAYRQRSHMVIDLATIEKGAQYLGMVASIPPEDLFTRWRSEYESDIVVSIASLAGERMFFGSDNSSGVYGDLTSATQVATWMESRWGMGKTIAVQEVLSDEYAAGGGGTTGTNGAAVEAPLPALAARIEDRLQQLYQQAWDLLAENRREVLAVAHALETHKTISGDDVEAVIEGRQGQLVDGRPYVDPQFLVMAEQYHAEAVRAHEGHADVAVTLPQFS